MERGDRRSMSKLLSELVALVEADVPAEGGVPTALQYEQAVKDAVRDFSERCGLEQIGTLNIVSGTATYDLPADFLRMIRLDTFASPDGVMNTPQGLVPLSVDFCERYTIRNGQITFYPTPRYALTGRRFRYKAGWALTEAVDEYDSSAYETLGEREARIVVLKAKALASSKKANASAGAAVKYSFGAVSEDLTGLEDGYRSDIKAFEADYAEACAKYNGTAMAA